MKFAWSITFFKNGKPITLIEDYTIVKITDKQGSVYEGLVTSLDNLESGTFYITDKNSRSYEIDPYDESITDVEIIEIKSDLE